MEKEIEKLVSKWEKELRELEKEYEKYYLNGTYIHASRLSGRKTQLITCLVQLKNLKPNELRAVNRNEAAKEIFQSVTCTHCGKTFNDLLDAEGHRCTLRKND